MQEVSTKLMTFNRKENLLEGEVTDILGENEIPRQMTVISAKTGNKEVFVHTRTERGMDGVVYWEFTSPFESMGTKIRLYND